MGAVTYQVMVENLFWKWPLGQLRSLAGSKVADTEPMAESPLDDAYPEVVPHVVLPSPRGLQNLVPISSPEEPDLSAVQQSQKPNVSITEEPAKTTEEPTKAQVPKCYPTRVCSKPRQLIEEM